MTLQTAASQLEYIYSAGPNAQIYFHITFFCHVSIHVSIFWHGPLKLCDQIIIIFFHIVVRHLLDYC